MGRTDQPRDARIEYDLFMGLARCTAMPITVAAALLCAPLAAQTRPSENNAKRLIEKADRLAWLYNWYLAGPLYAEAEKLFEQAGDSRNALYAKIGRLRSEWETMSFPEVSEYLATQLDSALVENDPRLRLWILDAKGAQHRLPHVNGDQQRRRRDASFRGRAQSVSLNTLRQAAIHRLPEKTTDQRKKRSIDHGYET